ncbi:hypothetical protein LX16_1400 [Stackebrandtia albiflava]|uniref:Probable membrane transporter protein n=1 Tax=Stackebrandtia albiflava TaxID=406432 RepID=A0A562VCT6_9ACTN|nr:sulfite exporter TauE/SafE family protein [Stackebrandtia albiflava]TWJ15689.1 hypothetical protein LX16_1400 [Stackebrandtia albiflava]
MPTLIIIAAAGLLAQLIDGGLGMGYGVISTSLLLATGLAPAAASATVHLAEIGTTLVSGISHWRFGNIDWGVTLRIAVPGAIGAFLGATALANLPAANAAPWTAGILILLGIYLLTRFARPRAVPTSGRRPLRTRHLAPLGLVGGAVDATGGGGWGPIATTTLLAGGRLHPRKTIGSVSAAEFAVSVAASIGFLIALTDSGILWPAVAALLIGGAVAAPLAAWLVRRLPTHILGTAVGGVIIATNARTVLNALDAATTVHAVTYTAVAAAWATTLVLTLRNHAAKRLQTATAA